VLRSGKFTGLLNPNSENGTWIGTGLSPTVQKAPIKAGSIGGGEKGIKFNEFNFNSII